MHVRHCTPGALEWNHARYHLPQPDSRKARQVFVWLDLRPAKRESGLMP